MSSPESRRQRGEQWFRLGERAVSAALGEQVEGYPCPLCLQIFPIEALCFGYHWAATPALEPVREQLRRPETDLLPLTILQSDVSDRSVAIVTPPAWPRCLVVTIDLRQVFLPWDWVGEGFFQELMDHRRSAPKGSTTFDVLGVAWPTEPRYELDLSTSQPA